MKRCKMCLEHVCPDVRAPGYVRIYLHEDTNLWANDRENDCTYGLYPNETYEAVE